MTSLSKAQSKPSRTLPEGVIQLQAKASGTSSKGIKTQRESNSYDNNVIDLQQALIDRQQALYNKNVMLLNVMAYMAVSDRSIEEQELEAVCDCYQGFASKNISKSDVQQLANSFHYTSAQILSDLQEAGPSLSKSDKEKLICAAYFVLMADRVVTAQEQCFLRKIAETLNMSEIHYQFVLEEFVARTGLA